LYIVDCNISMLMMSLIFGTKLHRKTKKYWKEANYSIWFEKCRLL